MKDASSKMILSSDELSVIFHRICCQLIEEHEDFKSSALIGLQPRGVIFAHRIQQILKESYGIKDLRYGELDTTFFRDDFRRREAPLNPNQTAIDFLVEDAKVIFLDDVLFTGQCPCGCGRCSFFWTTCPDRTRCIDRSSLSSGSASSGQHHWKAYRLHQ